MDSCDRIIFDEEHYDILLQNIIPKTRRYLLITTANIKNIFNKQGADGKWSSYLLTFEKLLQRNVVIKIIHSSKVSQSFSLEINKIKGSDSLCLFECARNHQKIIIRDGEFAYVGSGNFTGAAIGAKNQRRRNLETGIITTDGSAVDLLKQRFDEVISYKYCYTCDYRKNCLTYTQRKYG